MSLINANNKLNDLLIAFVKINIASKHRLFEPNLKSTFNELVRNLLGNWSQKLNDLSLDGIGFVLHQEFVKSIILITFLTHFWIGLLAWLSWIKVTVVLLSLLLNPHLINDLAWVFVVKLKHAMSGEMVITPIEKLKMVPAINTRDENITQSSVNWKPDIQEGIWSKESSVRTSKHFSEDASVLITIIFGKFADTELFFFVKLIFIAFVLWWAFLDIEACINYALKTTNDHNDIRFLIDEKIVENFISYEWLNKRSFRLWWCWTTYILRIRLFNNLCISWFIIIKSDIWILLTFFGNREERNINSFEKFAVAIHQ